MPPIILKVHCQEDDSYLIVREGAYELLDLNNSKEDLCQQIKANKYLGSLKYCLDHYHGPLELDSMKVHITSFITNKKTQHIHRVDIKDDMILLRHPASTWGFVKGCATEEDEGNPKKTVIREFYEEMGIEVPEEEIHCEREGIYIWTIDSDRRQEILDRFYEEWHGQSEVYNPLFVTPEEILEADRSMFELTPVRQGFREGFIIEKYLERYNAVRMNTVSYESMNFPKRKTRTTK